MGAYALVSLFLFLFIAFDWRVYYAHVTASSWRARQAEMANRGSDRLASSPPNAAWHAYRRGRHCSRRTAASTALHVADQPPLLVRADGLVQKLVRDHHRRQEHALDVEARQAQSLPQDLKPDLAWARCTAALFVCELGLGARRQEHLDDTIQTVIARCHQARHPVVVRGVEGARGACGSDEQSRHLLCLSHILRPRVLLLLLLRLLLPLRTPRSTRFQGQQQAG